jgi:hypothetical protein
MISGHLNNKSEKGGIRFIFDVLFPTSNNHLIFFQKKGALNFYQFINICLTGFEQGSKERCICFITINSKRRKKGE